jgi:hypothetical protein
MQASAVLSSCGRYRYELRRVWDASRRAVLFVCLNPSTADAVAEDGTSRICIHYARSWGFGTLLLGNLFALRSRDPGMLKKTGDPVGPDNDKYLGLLQSEASLVVCAWGDAGALRGRDRDVLRSIEKPHCLATLKSGRPGHPLYKSVSLCAVPYAPLGAPTAH